MNQNGDEKRIQQLFREMSDGDRLRTPAFSRVVQGASSSALPFRIGVSRRLAFTFAAVCVVMIALAIVTMRHQTPVNQVAEITQPSAQPPNSTDLFDRHPAAPKLVVPTPVEVIKPLPVVRVRHVRHHKPVNELALAMKLSTWRSPTASLLPTNDDDKLMSLPKLGESLKTLRSYSPDDLN